MRLLRGGYRGRVLLDGCDWPEPYFSVKQVPKQLSYVSRPPGTHLASPPLAPRAVTHVPCYCIFNNPIPVSQIRYGSASTSTPKNPCTNVPILCVEGGCFERGVQFWSYNIAAHYSGVHSELRVSNLIRRAMQLLLNQSDMVTTDVVTPARLIAESIGNEHTAARDVIIKILSERAAVIALKQKQSSVASAHTAKRPRVAAPSPGGPCAVSPATAMGVSADVV